MIRLLAVPFLVAMSLGTGCAGGHNAMRGSVVMKTSETNAHVCLGRGEVAVNDEVDLYRNRCQPSPASEPAPNDCSREVVGRGKVEKVLNDHFSVVRFPAGTPFKEGDTVEKAP